MQDIRCGNCHKKLGIGKFSRIIIKCPRCKVINQLSAESADPEQPRAPIGVIPYDKSDNPMDGRQTPLSR
ncbi:Com family DNA-binding transcriptional regulator [Undibacterium sp. WLX3042]|uniref:Com family DNA-binding transcriptional regulator n=1 Tax=Undibacterium sp. WLX3042 TaxID=3412686 RepID=UPI003C2B8067